jgi:hypothetical protein
MGEFFNFTVLFKFIVCMVCLLFIQHIIEKSTVHLLLQVVYTMQYNAIQEALLRVGRQQTIIAQVPSELF